MCNKPRSIDEVSDEIIESTTEVERKANVICACDSFRQIGV